MRPQRFSYTTALLALVLLWSGCSPSRIATVEAPSAPAGHENLHSVLWTQTSIEYGAVTQQIFQLATHRIDDALADTSWTAAVEQQEMASFGTLPPAVVLDIDETVLDNSYYQARLVLSNAEYDLESWQQWVREEAATAVPGALEFALEAVRRGVAVVYLSNRRAETEPATRANLVALGFPVADDFDAIISRGEQADWSMSDKETRRRAVAERFRILMLLGDNLGDFLPHVETTVDERRLLAARYRAYWGERWFMLPNPQYGSWESVLFGGNYSLTPEERLRAKRRHLNPGQ